MSDADSVADVPPAVPPVATSSGRKKRWAVRALGRKGVRARPYLKVGISAQARGGGGGGGPGVIRPEDPAPAPDPLTLDQLALPELLNLHRYDELLE